MWHMTYLRDLFERSQQGDVVIRALSTAVAAIDPGLQLTFVFDNDAAKALKETGKLPETAEPQALQLRLNAAVRQGIQHPCLVAAQLRRIADELEDVAMTALGKAVAADLEAAKPKEAAPPAVQEAPAALPPQ